MNSDERAVAQIAKELLESHGEIGLNIPVALEDSDDELKLPCMVVVARFEEDTRISLLGRPLKRYALSIDYRGNRLAQSSDTFDSAFNAIDSAMFPSPVPSLASESLFTRYDVDIQSGSDHNVSGDTRTRTRSYDVFAVLAG